MYLHGTHARTEQYISPIRTKSFIKLLPVIGIKGACDLLQHELNTTDITYIIT